MGALVVLAVGVTSLCILYVFANFSYTISDDLLIIRWRILRWLPFQTHKVKLADIREARRLHTQKALLSGGVILGNLPPRKAVILTVKKSIRYPTSTILITPERPDSFIAEISKAIADREA